MKYGFIIIGMATLMFCAFCIGTIKMSHSYVTQPDVPDEYSYSQGSVPSPCARHEYYICREGVNGRECRCE